MDNNSPSFTERIAELKTAALMLRESGVAVSKTAEVIMAEVLRMEAAQSRFSARRPQRQTQRASR